jgi:TolB protein
VLDVASGKETTVADETGVNFRPAWSPDGRHIAYVHGTAMQTPFDLWVMDPDGAHKRQLTMGGMSTQPSWSPDGRRLVYNVGSAIWIVGADGSGAHMLATPTAGAFFTPSWAPGPDIVYTSTQDGGGKQVYVMSPDGSHQHRLVSDGGEDKYPSWSPDGRTIVYSASTVPCRGGPSGGECALTQLGGFEIFLVPASGGPPRRLTDTAPEPQFGESFPVFRPAVR